MKHAASAQKPANDATKSPTVVNLVTIRITIALIMRGDSTTAAAAPMTSI
jgi:hypothetical protein